MKEDDADCWSAEGRHLARKRSMYGWFGVKVWNVHHCQNPAFDLQRKEMTDSQINGKSTRQVFLKAERCQRKYQFSDFVTPATLYEAQECRGNTGQEVTAICPSRRPVCLIYKFLLPTKYVTKLNIQAFCCSGELTGFTLSLSLSSVLLDLHWTVILHLALDCKTKTVFTHAAEELLQDPAGIQAVVSDEVGVGFRPLAFMCALYFMSPNSNSNRF